MRIARCLGSGLVLGLVACVTPPVTPRLDRPEDSAQGFYTQLRHPPVIGLPSAEAWPRLRHFCTEGLAAALEKARSRQAAFRQAHPDEKPPWVDGDLFSSLFEGPQAFQLGAARVVGDRAEVPVHCVHGEGAGATRWTDVLILRQTADGWRVDDLRYGGEWDFALRGSLRQGLSAAVD
jgi:hypothetical protein